ncbi:MAG: hypothetical protein D6760_01455 [Deltaproteobacteria bacterium]|nr:MAG: hypothetical protein D6760_01455 [Deltaproteobacteria bacterium]
MDAFVVFPRVTVTGAQPLDDHTKCYEVKDHARFVVEVGLATLQSEFGLEHCTVQGKPKVFCMPVNEDVTACSAWFSGHSGMRERSFSNSQMRGSRHFIKDPAAEDLARLQRPS